MTIGRMQMNRQLYGLGSYFPPENGREKFGLGSKLKKFVRNIIPNEVADIAVKAAPFVAPFNPLLAGYMAGIGGFDQTGSIGSSLKRGLLTYGGGQLGRYIGGAGFQQGINPFAGYNPASSFGGISSLFTSPIGTQTGLQLGQYEMFGGPGSGGDQATRKAVSEQLAQASRDAAVPPGSFIDAGVDSGIKVADYTGELISNTGGEVAKQASRGYTDLLKSVVSPDSTLIERGQAVMDLGGKALKDIYTTPVKPYVDASGNLVDSKLDKTAVIATLAMIPSYLDAKKAADDAGIEEFDEATYNAERDKYMERYKANLPTSSFGIQAAANGGRIGYGDGTKPSAEENTPSQEIINRRIAQIKDMSKRGADIDTIKSITGASDQMIKDVLGQANGGRIGYKQGTPKEGIVSLTDEDSGVIYRDPDTEEPITKEEFLRRAQEDEDKQYMSPTDQGSGVIYRDEKGNPISKEEWLRLSSDAPSITLPEKETKGMKKYKYESDPYLLQLMRKTGEDVFFFGEPNPELNYREFDKMPMDYQNKVEDKREGRRRFYQKYDYKQAPRYERMGYQEGGGPLRPMVMSDRRVNNNSNMAIMPFVSPTLNTDNQGRLVNSITGVPLNRELMPEPAAAARSVDTTRGASVNQLFNYYKNKEMDEARRQQIIDLFMRDNAATGGRMGYAMGSEVPVRRNEGGITELDYRNTGGFVPIGVKEKADDVPAMLSKNEFVFTADAVRAAGGGSVQKGAQKMYNTMKMLEGKLV
jgi:hypothetical protein